MKIKKGDLVRVIYGKDKGREGKVEKVYQRQQKVLISGINICKKHVKKNEQLPQGGIIDIARPLEVSKVILICPACKKTTRISYRREKKKKFRFCKKCQNKI